MGENSRKNQQQKNSKSHSLTEVLVKLKLNSAAVWNICLHLIRCVVFTKEVQIYTFAYFKINFYSEKY